MSVFLLVALRDASEPKTMAVDDFASSNQFGC